MCSIIIIHVQAHITRTHVSLPIMARCTGVEICFYSTTYSLFILSSHTHTHTQTRTHSLTNTNILSESDMSTYTNARFQLLFKSNSSQIFVVEMPAKWTTLYTRRGSCYDVHTFQCKQASRLCAVSLAFVISCFFVNNCSTPPNTSRTACLNIYIF